MREVIGILSKVEVRARDDVEVIEEQRRRAAEVQQQEQHMTSNALSEETPTGHEGSEPFVRRQPKIGRNEPCPCGSGKKYKQCHGKLK